MAPRRSNPEFLNGVPELLILRLVQREPAHGYEIVRQIRLLSAGRLEFGEGCIYPILHRLESEGAIRSERRQVGGRRRVVYRITRRGQRKLAEARSRWDEMVAAVHRVWEGVSGETGEVA
ncbi:MAG TPA: PadR family transcriptional regulator [Planctomycetaceae bacterium]|nr:PadR family transcriptional regulator [Planctomycetaceae bacterium]